jgi:hypothetical protein
MNEQELRDSLRQVMVASSPPPSMNPNAALDSARRAHKRRRATFAGTAAGVAVVALAAGTAFALSPGETPLPVDPAGPGQPAVVTAAPPVSGGADQQTKPEWPGGQQDRTATNGPQAAKGDALLASLKTQLPDTVTVNTTITYPDTNPSDKRPVTASQSQFVDYVNGDRTKQIWEYAATVAVNSKAAPTAGTGRVMVQTVIPGNTKSTDVCDVAKSFWGAGGTCAPRLIQGKTVGVITKSDDQRLDQVVAYRYDDGVTVIVAQSRQPSNEGDSTKPADGSMAQPPLTIDQLTPLVLSPAFKLG